LRVGDIHRKIEKKVAFLRKILNEKVEKYCENKFD